MLKSTLTFSFPYLRLTLGILMLCLFSNSLEAQDIEAPQAPIIDSVTYQFDASASPENSVVIRWKASNSPDVRSYYIKYFNEALGVYKLIDSVDAHTLFYVDKTSVKTETMIQTYVVQAVDSSNNASVHSLKHTVIGLQSNIVQKNCKNKILLDWSAYKGWKEGVEYYQVWSGNSHLWHLDTTLLSSTLSIELDLKSSNSNQYYLVRGISYKNKSSSSNVLTVNLKEDLLPRFINALYANVKGKSIEVEFNLDPQAQINNYQLYRKNISSNKTILLATFSDYKEAVLNYTDTKAKVQKTAYQYYLKLVDDCDNVMDSSNTVTSVYLKGKVFQEPYINQLNWSFFKNNKAENITYSIIRSTSKQGEKTLAQYDYTFPYQDDLEEQNYNEFDGRFYYKIQIKSDLFPEKKVYSNTICLRQTSIIYIPTAFQPFGTEKNRIFKPFCNFISEKNYYFAVYNRWGVKVFETKDKNKGWDGKKDNVLCPVGRYVYFLEYVNSSGKKHSEHGSCFLDY